MDRRIAVIIPAYNEEKTIAGVIRGVRGLGEEYQVIVVNDSSRDDTTKNAEAEGAIVLELPVNLGIGGAVQTGFKYAFDHGFDACVQVDGDGQHPPGKFPSLSSVSSGRTSTWWSAPASWAAFTGCPS